MQSIKSHQYVAVISGQLGVKTCFGSSFLLSNSVLSYFKILLCNLIGHFVVRGVLTFTAPHTDLSIIWNDNLIHKYGYGPVIVATLVQNLLVGSKHSTGRAACG